LKLNLLVKFFISLVSLDVNFLFFFISLNLVLYTCLLDDECVVNFMFNYNYYYYDDECMISY
jgi:hypothetical protein